MNTISTDELTILHYYIQNIRLLCHTTTPFIIIKSHQAMVTHRHDLLLKGVFDEIVKLNSFWKLELEARHHTSVTNHKPYLAATRKISTVYECAVPQLINHDNDVYKM